MEGFLIKLSKVIEELKLTKVFFREEFNNISVYSKDINRMGLELMGSTDDFDPKRIIIMGQSENFFLNTLSKEEIYKSAEALFKLKCPALIVARNLEVHPEILRAAKKYDLPILSSDGSTSEVITNLVSFLNIELAPRIVRSGGLLSVHGEGILLVGESCVGKSETAVELLNRGHKLIGDDSIEIRRISKNTLVGSAPENIRYFVELRGIGVINARRIFGVGAVKITEKVDMVINLEIWKEHKLYDRMGSVPSYTEILDVKVPYLTIPVRHGRNLAVIIEVAAMNNRQRKLGYNAAKELFSSLGMEHPSQTSEFEKCIWDIY